MKEMKEIKIDEQKKMMLDMLKDTHRFCEDNNIKYYICYGTLLGAVRHKGYIPWDDDIDIFMPRPDYMRFIEIYNKTENKKYKVSSIHNNPRHFHPFAVLYDKKTIKIYKNVNYDKFDILGVGIDIFPIDGLPDDLKSTKKYFIRMRKLLFFHAISVQKCPKGSTFIRTVLKVLFMAFIRLYSFQRVNLFNVRLNETAMKYDYTQSEYVACIAGSYGKKEKLSKAAFNETIKLEFEREFFYAPIGYDEYLTNIYGDYMNPPKKKKSIHDFKAYRKD